MKVVQCIHNAMISPLQEGQSPLQLACMGGHGETVKLLLEKKAHVDLPDEVR